MELIAGLTIWACFAVFLLGPVIGAPPRLHRAAMTLLCGELLALLIWSYRASNCELDASCGPIAETAHTAAAVDLPLLAAVGCMLTLWVTWRRSLAAARA
jgi:hypothetical protein